MNAAAGEGDMDDGFYGRANADWDECRCESGTHRKSRQMTVICLQPPASDGVNAGVPDTARCHRVKGTKRRRAGPLPVSRGTPVINKAAIKKKIGMVGGMVLNFCKLRSQTNFI